MFDAYYIKLSYHCYSHSTNNAWHSATKSDFNNNCIKTDQSDSFHGAKDISILVIVTYYAVQYLLLQVFIEI